MDASTPLEPSERPAAPVRGARPRRTALLALPVVGLLAGLGWLFSGAGSEPAPPTDLADLPRVDGTLTVVEPDRLVMTAFEPLEGSTEVEFAVPEKYAGNFDLAHLRSHSSVGIPTRIYYLERDGELLAVYKADAPVNGSGG